MRHIKPKKRWDKYVSSRDITFSVICLICANIICIGTGVTILAGSALLGAIFTVCIVISLYVSLYLTYKTLSGDKKK